MQKWRWFAISVYLKHFTSSWREFLWLSLSASSAVPSRASFVQSCGRLAEKRAGTLIQDCAYISMQTMRNHPRFPLYGVQSSWIPTVTYKQPPDPDDVVLMGSSLTTSNVAIATASIVVYLVRTSLALLNFNRVALNFGYDVLLSGLWYYSVSAQSSADMTDMKHPSPRPWYLGRSCGEAGGKYAYACTVSKISFDFSIALM